MVLRVSTSLDLVFLCIFLVKALDMKRSALNESEDPDKSRLTFSLFCCLVTSRHGAEIA